MPETFAFTIDDFYAAREKIDYRGDAPACTCRLHSTARYARLEARRLPDGSIPAFVVCSASGVPVTTEDETVDGITVPLDSFLNAADAAEIRAYRLVVERPSEWAFSDVDEVERLSAALAGTATVEDRPAFVGTTRPLRSVG